MLFKEKLLTVLKIAGVYALYIACTTILVFLVRLLPKEILAYIGNSANLSYLFETVLLFVGFMIPVFISVRILCKTPIKQLGISFSAKWLTHWGIGLAVGSVSILIIWFAILLMGGYKVITNGVNAEVVSSLICLVVVMLFVGFQEEVFARGAMAYVGRKEGRIFRVIVISFIFSLMHMVNGSFDILTLINLVLFAVVLFQFTWVSGDLWMAIGYHTAWNIMQGLLGVNISGKIFNSFITSDYSVASNILNGGEFGIESSLLAVIFLIMQIIVLDFLFIKRNRVNPTPTADWLSK